MKRLHISDISCQAIVWMVLVLISPTQHAAPAEGFASQLQHVLEQQGWAKEQAPDGSLHYYPTRQLPKSDPAERLRHILERKGWQIEKGPDGSLISRFPKVEEPVVQFTTTVEPGPETKTMADAPGETARLVEKPGLVVQTETPAASPREDVVDSAIDGQAPTRTTPTTPQPSEQDRQARIRQQPGFYGHPMHRPLRPERYLPHPHAGYRSVMPPCPHGPWDCGWRRAGKRPAFPAPGITEHNRQHSNTGDE